MKRKHTPGCPCRAPGDGHDCGGDLVPYRDLDFTTNRYGIVTVSPLVLGPVPWTGTLTWNGSTSAPEWYYTCTFNVQETDGRGSSRGWIQCLEGIPVMLQRHYAGISCGNPTWLSTLKNRTSYTASPFGMTLGSGDYAWFVH